MKYWKALFATVAYVAVLLAIYVLHMRYGKVNVVPAQSPRLSEDQIKIVASYVWAQSHPVKTASAK